MLPMFEPCPGSWISAMMGFKILVVETLVGLMAVFLRKIPSRGREVTCPTNGVGKAPSKLPGKTGYVSFQQGRCNTWS